MKRFIPGFIGFFAWLFALPAMGQDVVTDEQLLAADLKKGQRAFLRCRACHTLGEDERNKVGPNLWEIFGNEIGVRDDFNYSKVLREADLVWTADLLNEWLIKPKDFLPGNKMAFVGLPREQQRVDLIAYLMRETGFVIGGGSGPHASDGAAE